MNAVVAPERPVSLARPGLGLDRAIEVLKAAAEPTRLRILVLLAEAELNVSDLTRILGQSQPRISRHLKLLVEAGMIERFRDGTFVFFHVAESGDAAALTAGLLETVDRRARPFSLDRERAGRLRRERAESAKRYFDEHAAEWGRIRTLHVAEDDVETAMRRTLGPGPFRQFLDLGTGTGRILEIFADTYTRGLGLDLNQSMLAYARANLQRGASAKAQVRHGDLYEVALADASADAIVMHQVLHFLDEPQRAIEEAARLLAPGGRFMIVDFAPHDVEALREEHRHVRLGFPREQVTGWLEHVGLEIKPGADLAPRGSAPGLLTVSLWLAERPKSGSPARRPRRPRASIEVTP